MPGKKVAGDRRREQILKAASRVAFRYRVAGLSSRAVAAEAGVSNGLVFFYFRNRRVLLLALLDWLLEQTILRHAVERDAAPGEAASRLAAEIRRAAEKLPRDRKRIELFFEYWSMASHDEVIRKRIRSALKRYRESYLPLARAVVAERSEGDRNVTGESLADVVTNFIEGCALRVIAEPRSFDARTCSEAVAALLAR
jgi:TetR/AcrR family transcriptional regulator, transcriptional repressor of bet genes